MERFGFEEGQVLAHPLITRAIEVAQRRVENYNFEIRKQLLEYDNVMNRQREVIYEERNIVLYSRNLKEHILSMAQDVLESKIDLHLRVEPDIEPDIEVFKSWLSSVYPLDISNIDFKSLDFDNIENELLNRIKAAYNQREESLGIANMRALEKIITLSAIDRHWKEHLYAMDELREGIGLRAYGQRNPLVEYQQEAHYFFSQMIERIKEEVTGTIFRVVPIKVGDEQRFGIFSSLPLAFQHEEKGQFEALPQKKIVSPQGQNLPSPITPERQKTQVHTFRRTGKKIGRNEPCPCGSGKKYKKCCGR
jgi:preprotein translocase subunit SecA